MGLLHILGQDGFIVAVWVSVCLPASLSVCPSVCGVGQR